MISLRGTWQDGRTSGQVPSVCRVYDNGRFRVERVQDSETLLTGPASDLRASPRVADTPRHLHFPTGEKFETDDHENVDRVLRRFRPPSWLHRVYRLESRMGYVLVALAVLLLCLWAGVKYGIPAAAQLIARRLPVAVLDQAGRQTLEILDRTLWQPSELKEATRERLIERFRPVLGEIAGYDLTVLFRKGGHSGPNAYALPNGTIIFTDEMVRLADRDEELLAVLAHEIGHVVLRHGMRTLVQDSLLGFGLLALTGDVSGSSELLLGLPVLLTQLAYSRGFEREADRYALQWLRSHAIAPHHFASLMRRMEKQTLPQPSSRSRRWPDYLSTHPLTDTRLQDFERPRDK